MSGNPTVLYAVIFFTVLVSVICFRNYGLLRRLSLDPYIIFRNKQWERIITHGFVHADWIHLIINMFVLWSFGEFVLSFFRLEQLQGISFNADGRFILLYFGGMAAASLYDIIRMRNNPHFSSIGASGAVSAVVFTSIFLSPMSKVYIFGAIPMPGILFGIMYIAYESYSARNTQDRINHHAHIFGAVFGFIYPILTGGLSQVNNFLNGFSNLFS